MKKILFPILVFSIVSTAVAGNAANPSTDEVYPMPVPVRYAADMDRPIAFDASTRVVLDCADPAALPWLNDHFARWFGAYAPRVVSGARGANAEPLMAGEEAYAINADATGVAIAARSIKGTRWAAYTLRQMLIAKRGSFKIEGRLLPTCAISDAPHLAFRGIHLCWIPEVRATQIERAIRTAAMMKFNYAVIEPWGMYQSAKHPWWGWPNGKMTKAEIHRLVALGKDLGITLIPQINVFGHASSARSCSRKHAILDFYPEYEPLFEPGGWNWCLSNPETQRVLRELIVEMVEDFDRPPYFHLGCDEADPPGCPECRKAPYGELVCRHIAGLAKFVGQHGAKAMIWHDMLLKRGDPRWKGFTAFGTDTTATLADTLPKDVIICDWQYSYGNMKEVRKDWPTTTYLIGKGFPVVCSPWMNFNAMRPMADNIAERKGFGYLQTTWHHLRGDDWIRMYKSGSSAAWGGGEPPKGATYQVFGAILRLIGHDMKLKDPTDTGILNYQVPPAWWVDNG